MPPPRPRPAAAHARRGGTASPPARPATAAPHPAPAAPARPPSPPGSYTASNACTCSSSVPVKKGNRSRCTRSATVVAQSAPTHGGRRRTRLRHSRDRSIAWPGPRLPACTDHHAAAHERQRAPRPYAATREEGLRCADRWLRTCTSRSAGWCARHRRCPRSRCCCGRRAPSS